MNKKILYINHVVFLHYDSWNLNQRRILIKTLFFQNRVRLISLQLIKYKNRFLIYFPFELLTHKQIVVVLSFNEIYMETWHAKIKNTLTWSAELFWVWRWRLNIYFFFLKFLLVTLKNFVTSKYLNDVVCFMIAERNFLLKRI